MSGTADAAFEGWACALTLVEQGRLTLDDDLGDVPGRGACRPARALETVELTPEPAATG